MKRLIIVGSPRAAGRSARLAETLFEANIDEHPEDELFLVPVSEVEIGPCIACDGCREKSGVILKGEDGEEVTVQRHRCVFDDDMQMLYDLIDDVDEVTIVSPIYFSGAPAQLKCLLDRLQPYYWANARSGQKRPASLHVVGEGGDPHGHEALASEVRSALAVAGFRLERVLDWVGRIDEQGEITAEAKLTTVDGEGGKQRAKLSLSNAPQPEARKAASAFNRQDEASRKEGKGSENHRKTGKGSASQHKGGKGNAGKGNASKRNASERNASKGNANKRDTSRRKTSKKDAARQKAGKGRASQGKGGKRG